MDIMSGKTPPKGSGTAKNESPVITLPTHKSGEYNGFNRAGNSKTPKPTPKT